MGNEPIDSQLADKSLQKRCIRDMSDQPENQEPNPFSDFPKHWRVSENGAPLSAQREYIDYHRYVDPEKCMQADVAEIGKTLFSHKATIEEKKRALVILAHNGTVEAYRTLEKYVGQAEEELAGWAALALHECQAFLEASLEDASVGMAMGGLGGAGDKMRYFLAVKAKKGSELARAGQAAIEVTFRQVGQRLNVEIERFQFGQGYAAMEVLIPLDVAVAEFAERGIRATNRVDVLLEKDYYVRNDRVPTENEMLNWVQETKESSNFLSSGSAQ
jgi:hypothetical protein